MKNPLIAFAACVVLTTFSCNKTEFSNGYFGSRDDLSPLQAKTIEVSDLNRDRITALTSAQFNDFYRKMYRETRDPM